MALPQSVADCIGNNGTGHDLRPVIQRQLRGEDGPVSPEGRLAGRLDLIFRAVASLVETRIVQGGQVGVEFVADLHSTTVARHRRRAEYTIGPFVQRYSLARTARGQPERFSFAKARPRLGAEESHRGSCSH